MPFYDCRLPVVKPTSTTPPEGSEGYSIKKVSWGGGWPHPKKFCGWLVWKKLRFCGWVVSCFWAKFKKNEEKFRSVVLKWFNAESKTQNATGGPNFFAILWVSGIVRPPHDSIWRKFCRWVVRKILWVDGRKKIAILRMGGLTTRVWSPSPLTFLME